MRYAFKITALLLIFAIASGLCACNTVNTDELWVDAKYNNDAELGEGASAVSVTVEAGERSVRLTLNTDKATLGEALFEHGLVNDPTFFDTCNGIKADWDKDAAYWAFIVDGERVNYGIGDGRAPANSEHEYSIVYTK